MQQQMRSSISQMPSGTALLGNSSAHRLHQQFRLGQFAQRRLQQRITATPQAMMGSGPAYNKYKTRQEIERDYYREWERTTLVAKEELERPMTVFTFLAFLPAWFRFYGLPGPIRFVCYLIYQKFAVVYHKFHKKMVIQGAKVDTELVKRAKLPSGTFSREMVMLRYHYRISPIENIKFRVALLQGKVYKPIVKPLPHEPKLKFDEGRLTPENYNPSEDSWSSAVTGTGV